MKYLDFLNEIIFQNIKLPRQIRNNKTAKSKMSKIIEKTKTLKRKNLTKLLLDFLLNSEYTFKASLALIPIELILNLVLVFKVSCKTKKYRYFV